MVKVMKVITRKLRRMRTIALLLAAPLLFNAVQAYQLLPFIAD